MRVRPGRSWRGAIEGLLALLLLNLYSTAAVLLLAVQTGQWFADLGRAPLAVAALIGGHVAGHGRGRGKANVAWWLAAVHMLAARPTLRVAARRLLSGSEALISANSALPLRCFGVAAISFAPSMAALGWLTVHHLQKYVPWRDVQPATQWLAAIATLAPAVVHVTRQTCLVPVLGAVVVAAAAAYNSPHRRLSAGIALAMLVSVAVLQAKSCTHCGPVESFMRPWSLAEGSSAAVYRCEARQGGYITVTEGFLPKWGRRYKYRLMRIDHSIMGGHWLRPAEAANQSIYTAFYVQQTVRLLRPHGFRCLHVGMGAGTTVRGMQARNVVSDVLELHGEVVHAAEAYFHAGVNGYTSIGDAWTTVDSLPANHYDYVLLDVFLGGAIAPRLQSVEFLHKIKAAMTADGLLAIDFFGRTGPTLEALVCRVLQVCKHVRVFFDEDSALYRNYVLVGSDYYSLNRVNISEEAQLDMRYTASLEGDTQRDSVFARLGGLELNVSHLTADRCSAAAAAAKMPGSTEWWAQLRHRHDVAVSHWLTMRSQFGDAFWDFDWETQ